MAEQKVATQREKLKAQLAALGDEAAGYEARLAGLKDGGVDRLDERQLANKVKAVAAEQKRISALLGKKTKDDEGDEEA